MHKEVQIFYYTYNIVRLNDYFIIDVVTTNDSVYEEKTLKSIEEIRSD